MYTNLTRQLENQLITFRRKAAKIGTKITGACKLEAH